MEGGNPVQQTPLQTAQAPAAQQQAEQTPASASSSSGQASSSGNRMVVWLIMGLVLIVLVVGSIYLFLNQQQSSVQSSPQPITQAPSPTPQANLENDLNSVNIDTGTPSDFSAVDQDLQQL